MGKIKKISKICFSSYWAVLASLFIVGLLLRLYKITAWDVWFDEAYIINTALGNFHFFNSAGSIYNYILSFILDNFSSFSFFFMRFFSLICDLTAAMFVYKIAVYVFSRKTALISLMLFLLSAFHVWYSQEVAGYAFLGMVTSINIYYFFKIFKEGKLKYLFIYAISSLIAVVTFPYAAFLWVSEALFILLFSQKRKIRLAFLGSSFFVAVCYSFILFGSYFKSISELVFGGNFWISEQLSKSFPLSLSEMYIGYYGDKFLYLTIFILLVIMLFYLIGKWKKYASVDMVFFIWITLGQTLLFFIFSQYKPIYLTRYFFYVSGAFYILWARVLSEMPYRKLLISIIIGATLMGTVYYYFFPEKYKYRPYVGVMPKHEYCPDLFSFFDSHANAGDILAITTMRFGGGLTSLYSKHNLHCGNIEYEEKIYCGNLKNIETFDIPLLFLYADKQEDSIEYWYRVTNMHRYNNYLQGVFEHYTILEDYSFERLWLLVSWWNKNKGDYYDAMNIYMWCEDNFRRLNQFNFPDGFLVLYAK